MTAVLIMLLFFLICWQCFYFNGILRGCNLWCSWAVSGLYCAPTHIYNWDALNLRRFPNLNQLLLPLLEDFVGIARLNHLHSLKERLHILVAVVARDPRSGLLLTPVIRNTCEVIMALNQNLDSPHEGSRWIILAKEKSLLKVMRNNVWG